jgi:hypothetical protein
VLHHRTGWVGCREISATNQDVSCRTHLHKRRRHASVKKIHVHTTDITARAARVRTRQSDALVSPVSGLAVFGFIDGTSATAVAKSPSWLMLISHSWPSSMLTLKASPFPGDSDSSASSCPSTSCKASCSISPWGRADWCSFRSSVVIGRMTICLKPLVYVPRWSQALRQASLAANLPQC